MKRCEWAEPTPKIDGKYSSSPCKVMVWRETGEPVECNGWKPICLGKDPEILDRRDIPFSDFEE